MLGVAESIPYDPYSAKPGQFRLEWISTLKTDVRDLLIEIANLEGLHRLTRDEAESWVGTLSCVDFWTSPALMDASHLTLTPKAQEIVESAFDLLEASSQEKLRTQFPLSMVALFKLIPELQHHYIQRIYNQYQGDQLSFCRQLELSKIELYYALFSAGCERFMAYPPDTNPYYRVYVRHIGATRVLLELQRYIAGPFNLRQSRKALRERKILR